MKLPLIFLFISLAKSEYRSDDFGAIKEAFDLDPLQAESDTQEILKSLKNSFESMQRRGSEKIIPEIPLTKILANNGEIPEKIARKVKKRGILVVRRTILPQIVHDWMADLFRYLYVHNTFPRGNEVN